MRNYFLIATVFFVAFLSSCGSDDELDLVNFSVTFSTNTLSMTADEQTKEVVLTYSRAATEAGSINIAFSGENAVYGTDFTTDPNGSSGSISIPVAVGDTQASFTFTKLQDPIEGTSKSVSFSINSFDNTSWVNGAATTAQVSFTPIASLGGVIDLLTGGSTQPNQCYIDLSTGVQKAVKRDTWELGVYNGTENRVFLNSALLVSAAQIKGATDILAVTEATALSETLTFNTIDATFSPTTVDVSTVSEIMAGLPLGYTQYSNHAEGNVFTDLQAGNLEDTAFAEVSTTDSENFVYIVSLGNEVPTTEANPGAINTTGDHRGFMKVRILTDGNSYTIQYADVNETASFNTITVAKEANKVLTAISLSTGEKVDVEPASDQWDINFSGVFSYNGAQGPGYFGLTYSDYGLHNTIGNVGMYQVTTYETDASGTRVDLNVPSYTDFTLSDINDSSLVYDDRTVISSSWRSTTNGVAKDDRYFILKDASGNYYKLRFTALLSSDGVRGNSQFEYARLN